MASYHRSTTDFSESLSEHRSILIQVRVIDVSVNITRGRYVGMAKLLLRQLQASLFLVNERAYQMADDRL